MATVLLVIHILIALALIATVLLQRSEGGALGIGGGGGLMPGRGSGNVLTKITAILAACFFLSSIGLTILARTNANPGSKIDEIKIISPEDSGKVDKKPADNKAKTPDQPIIPAP